MGVKLPVPPTQDAPPHPEPSSRALSLLTMLTEQLESLEVHRPRDAALELMRALQGTTLRIPPGDEIERMVQTTQIVRELQRDASPRHIDRLAGAHGTTRRQISKTYIRATSEGLSTLRSRMAGVANRCVSLARGAVRRLRFRL